MKLSTILMVVAALILGACVRNDCDRGSVLGKMMTDVDLDQREAENSPSVRWYWCEAPLKEGDPVPAGKLGPIVNLHDGSDYGYGGWVRVLADDVTRFGDIARQYTMMGPATEPHRFQFMWAWTAAAIFAYDWNYEGPFQDPTPPPNEGLTSAGATTFIKYIDKTGNPPFGVLCYSVADVRAQVNEWYDCSEPTRRSPVTQSGGSTSGSTSGGSPTGGDWGPN